MFTHHSTSACWSHSLFVEHLSELCEQRNTHPLGPRQHRECWLRVCPIVSDCVRLCRLGICNTARSDDFANKMAAISQHQIDNKIEVETY